MLAFERPIRLFDPRASGFDAPRPIVERPEFTVIIRPSDRALTEEEWRTLLYEHGFGHFIASGIGREVPVVVPTHFAYDGASRIVMHFVRDNPVWEPLRESPIGLLSVAVDYVYIPSYWNAGEEAPEEWGVPTSYYAAVQVVGPCRIVDDPEEMARLLSSLLDHFQPEGRHAPVEAGDNPYGKLFPAIRGVEMTVRDIRAKFKFGGNRPVSHRRNVSAELARRDGPGDAEAREHMRRRTGQPL